MPQAPTIDPAEIERFEAMANKWWDPKGPFAPLHHLNPARLAFIRDEICRHFERNSERARSLDGLSVLDIGCGGGLIAEPLTRLGAAVTAIDPGSDNIAAAKTHAEAQGLSIDYRADKAESLAEKGETFDTVLCLEVVEHVPDVPAFIKMIAPLVKPGGLLVLSTLNRTLKSYALAIVGAEYILRWLEPGTHQWERFVKPEELSSALRQASLAPTAEKGLMYNPLSDRWSLTSDLDVNYFMTAKKSGNAAS